VPVPVHARQHISPGGSKLRGGTAATCLRNRQLVAANFLPGLVNARYSIYLSIPSEGYLLRSSSTRKILRLPFPCGESGNPRDRGGSIGGHVSNLKVEATELVRASGDWRARTSTIRMTEPIHQGQGTGVQSTLTRRAETERGEEGIPFQREDKMMPCKSRD
jgi:hypothetical protein